MGDNFCRKRDINDPEENTLFEVNAGESLLLWPKRRHVGVEDFPDDLKFYWLHFEVDARLPVLPGATPLSIEQHCSVRIRNMLLRYSVSF